MQLLYDAVSRSLHLAGQNGATSTSIPAIGSGLYKVPVDVCARVFFNAVISHFSANRSNTLKEIRFVNVDLSTHHEFLQVIQKRFPGSITEKVEAFFSNDAK